MFKQKNAILIIAVILIAASGLIYLAKKDRTPGGGQNNAADVRSIDSADHLIGNSEAPIQMIIYSDFECPFCAQFADTVKRVEENFKDRVAIAFRHYPLPGHAQALPAALAGECAAEQGRFWQMHDKLFADNAAGRMSAEQYKLDAAELGLNQEQFSQCLDSGKYAAKVAGQKAAAETAGITGTPATFINGKIYTGAYPFEDFTSGGSREAGMKTIISNLLK